MQFMLFKLLFCFGLKAHILCGKTLFPLLVGSSCFIPISIYQIFFQKKLHPLLLLFLYHTHHKFLVHFCYLIRKSQFVSSSKPDLCRKDTLYPPFLTCRGERFYQIKDIWMVRWYIIILSQFILFYFILLNFISIFISYKYKYFLI